MTKMFDRIMSTDTLMQNPNRPDFVLSNWVFLWFVLYFFGLVRHSPLLVIVIGIIANTYEYLSSRKGKSVAWELHYVFRNLLIKVLPVVYLFYRHDQIKWREDLITMVVVYGLFLFWVAINGALWSGTYRPMNPFNFNSKDSNL
jgi:hypothetical protein